MRIWEGDINDEGVRAFHQFILDTNNSSINLIEFLNCNITPLGCEFVSRLFENSYPTNIQYLTLDYNAFGNMGLVNLLTYIKDNRTLIYLSLNYCGIDEFGVKHMKKYLEHNPILEKLMLMGNALKNEGVIELCDYLSTSEVIEEINLSNTMFGDKKEAIEKLANLIETNKMITIYHVKFNFFSDENFPILLDVLKGENGKHIYQFNVDEKMNKDLFEQYFKTMKGRKYRPRKKKIVKPKKGK